MALAEEKSIANAAQRIVVVAAMVSVCCLLVHRPLNVSFVGRTAQSVAVQSSTPTAQSELQRLSREPGVDGVVCVDRRDLSIVQSTLEQARTEALATTLLTVVGLLDEQLAADQVRLASLSCGASDRLLAGRDSVCEDSHAQARDFGRAARPLCVDHAGQRGEQAILAMKTPPLSHRASAHFTCPPPSAHPRRRRRRRC